MNNLAKQTFQWQFNGKILLFTAFFLPVTISLGFWQLERADEKTQLLDVYNSRHIAQAVDFEVVDQQADSQYLQVVVPGQWRKEPTLLLDNRVRKGKPGFEVLNILDTNAGPMLVNRGWIKGSLDRSWRPTIAQLPEQHGVEVPGYLYQPLGKQVMLGEDAWDTKAAVAVIQNAAPEMVGQRLQEKFYPYMLRIKDSQSELDATWVVINVQPSKHIGYAVQWFAMAFALVVLTLTANSNLAAWIKSRRGK